MFFRLCLKLLDIDREMSNQSCGGEQACGTERPWLNVQKLQYDQERMAKNVLLSWQSFETLHRGYQCNVKPLALIGAWGALTDVADRSSHQSEKSPSWRSWLPRKTNQQLGWKARVNSVDMDETADLFTGGSLRGIMADVDKQC